MDAKKTGHRPAQTSLDTIIAAERQSVCELIADGFKPALFITGTYRIDRTRDDIAIDTRRYAVQASRKLRAHVSPLIGYKEFDNSHFHMTLFARDLNITDSGIALLQSRKLWGFGRVEVQRWKDVGGVHYTLKHPTISMAGEVFCPCKKRACRKNRCPHQLKQRG